jgi:16S rRNA (cytosine967-C5)-methyltransferase
MNARVAAAKVLRDVIDSGESLTKALPKGLCLVSDTKQHALVQELSYGVLRWLPRLDAIATLLLEKPLRSRDRDIYCLLLVGFYQLIYLRVPDHAAISETVAAARQLKKDWATKLINAVLRNLQRNTEQIIHKADAHESARLAHPEWLLNILKNDWPEHWQGVVAANNCYPPMTLRVNEIKISRNQYLDKLAKIECKAQPSAFTQQGIDLNIPMDVKKLPGFEAGEISVQDAAAQQATALLELKPQQRVLDVCAAPGGKTAHILETEPQLKELVAIEIDARRHIKLRENLTRLGLEATLVNGDATQVKSWWDGQLFDRILLDAPCSATGVIRRHPDIKTLRQPEDIKQVCETQKMLLNAVWPLLKPSGILLYVTCSVLSQENEQQISEFLHRHSAAKCKRIEVNWGQMMRYGRQILPGSDNMDGFYFACLEKIVGEK